jgi:hypothetical protein
MEENPDNKAFGLEVICFNAQANPGQIQTSNYRSAYPLLQHACRLSALGIAPFVPELEILLLRCKFCSKLRKTSNFSQKKKLVSSIKCHVNFMYILRLTPFLWMFVKNETFNETTKII